MAQARSFALRVAHSVLMLTGPKHLLSGLVNLPKGTIYSVRGFNEGPREHVAMEIRGHAEQRLSHPSWMTWSGTPSAMTRLTAVWRET